jgi:hypothetical protein
MRSLGAEPVSWRGTVFDNGTLVADSSEVIGDNGTYIRSHAP